MLQLSFGCSDELVHRVVVLEGSSDGWFEFPVPPFRLIDDGGCWVVVCGANGLTIVGNGHEMVGNVGRVREGWIVGSGVLNKVANVCGSFLDKNGFPGKIGRLYLLYHSQLWINSYLLV